MGGGASISAETEISAFKEMQVKFEVLKAEGRSDADIYAELKSLYNATTGAASGDAPPATAIGDSEKLATTAAAPDTDAEVADTPATGGGGNGGHFEKHVAILCETMRQVPCEGADDKGWQKAFLTRNPSKTLTQGHRWIGGYCENILIHADLGGRTLFEWWTSHIAKGDLETSLDGEEVFKRACAGLSATIPARAREAIEAGQELAQQDEKNSIMALKNIWDAPPPPEGLTGCGTNGTSAPEPSSWVFGGDMYAFGPLSLTRKVMSKNRKYVQGGGKGTQSGEALFSREEIEKHLGRPLADDEIDEFVDEPDPTFE